MPRLNIYVSNQNGQTQSRWGKANDNEKIFFFNQDVQANLHVTIVSEPGLGPALCKKRNGDPVTEIDVAPGDQTKAFLICDSYTGKTFKYTATIAGAAPEDPIIIIERSSHSVLTVANAAALGLIGGLVAGYFLGRLLSPRRSTTPA